MTIDMMLLFGGIAGLVIGVVFPRRGIGCFALILIPIAMLVYIICWQTAHPEGLRSTSSLDLVFGPLWPSLGALFGYTISFVVNHLFFSERNDS